MRDFQKTGRSVVMAKNGMAATSHPSATLAAIQVLQDGGNAMDAAIAACAVQCVVEPGSTGIGGDCFALYSEKGTDKITAFNGAGWAPKNIDVAALTATGDKFLPRQSAHAVTVPGAVDAWTTLREKFGSLPLSRLFAPAIGFAEDGYAVAPRCAEDWRMQAGLIQATPEGQELLLVHGESPRAGMVHKQPRLAASLRKIAAEGRKVFYEGEIAQSLVSYLQSKGGSHTLADFANYRGEFLDPIKVQYRGYEVHECPPPGQGIVALLLLNILQQKALAPNPLSTERLQTEIDATRLAYKVRDALLADPQFADMDVDYILSAEFARRVSAGDIAEVLASTRQNLAVEHKDTVYISVVDKDRNCASFINSVFHPFGSGLIDPQSGILLHNRGQSFELTPGHPNCIGPWKRPLHTIIPGMATQNGQVEYVFGVMGGHYQAMGHAHFLSKVVDYGMDIQAASDLPRLFPLPGQDIVECEHTMPQETKAGLEALGYQLAEPLQPAIGGAQAIRIDWDNGVLHGASDHRKDGCALGY